MQYNWRKRALYHHILEFENIGEWKIGRTEDREYYWYGVGLVVKSKEEYGFATAEQAMIAAEQHVKETFSRIELAYNSLPKEL